MKLLIGTTLTLALGTGAAAAGILPDPIQEAFADVADVVGIDLPRPTTTVVTLPDQPEPVDSTSTTGVIAEEPSTTAVSLAPLTAVLAMSTDPQAVDEPGGEVVFTVSVTNTAGRAVEVVELTDDVFGDLLDSANPNVAANTCPRDDLVLEAQESFSCTFQALVSGRGGDPDYSTATSLRVTDSHGFETTIAASAAVAFNDVDPIVALDVAPSLTTLPEPGGEVSVDVTITNKSQERVTLTSLVDEVFGDLLDPNNTLVAANTCPALSRNHAAGTAITCSFTADVVADASLVSSRHSTRVVVTDRQSNRATASKAFSIGFEDVPPAVSGSVTPSAIVVAAPGGPVTFTVLVANQSVEPVDLALLFDTAFGNLLAPSNANLLANGCASLAGNRVAVGEVLTCTFQASLVGNLGDPAHSSTLVVRAFDNESNPATATSTARVGFTVAGTTVGGVVFADGDADGYRGVGEVGIPGARVTVTIAGVGSTTVTTDADGSWSSLVMPGQVGVSVAAVPFGVDLTTGNAIQVVSAVGGVAVQAQAIGYWPRPQTIEGDLYVDFNGNRQQDSAEPGVPGVTVTLLDANGMPVGSTVTGSTGGYRFNPDHPGAYVAQVNGLTLPAGLTPWADRDAAADGSTIVTVGAGGTASGIDFGQRGTKQIDQDNFAVAPNAAVHLTWAGFDGVFGSGDDFVLTTTADAVGAYSFTGLPKGKYTVATE